MPCPNYPDLPVLIQIASKKRARVTNGYDLSILPVQHDNNTELVLLYTQIFRPKKKKKKKNRDTTP